MNFHEGPFYIHPPLLRLYCNRRFYGPSNRWRHISSLLTRTVIISTGFSVPLFRICKIEVRYNSGIHPMALAFIVLKQIALLHC